MQHGRISFVAVSDTGQALSDEVESRLFRCFANTKESGIGVGLTICQSIVEAHNGGLWAPPNKDGGVEFRFRWPVVELV